MKSSFGTNLQFTLFGESHGDAIGMTVQGLPPGFAFDFNKIEAMLTLRRGDQKFNTARQETTDYRILSGYYNHHTTGTPFTVIFPNRDTRSQDYAIFMNQPRPGHSDYIASKKYKNAQDPRGGGHFSGRLTSPIVFLGAMLLQMMQTAYPDFCIHSHIAQLQDVTDVTYYDLRKQAIARAFSQSPDVMPVDVGAIMNMLNSDRSMSAYYKELAVLKDHFVKINKSFPVIDDQIATAMLNRIKIAKQEQTTLGGKIETVIFHPPISMGEPFFQSVESVIASLLYSIGSVKAVEFGYGNSFNTASGVTVKDEIIDIKADKIATLYNYNGGINGGISNGEDIVFGTTLKPISSMQKLQHSYNIATQKIEPIAVIGRHDITIINRVIPVIEAMTVIGLYDLLLADKLYH